MTNMLLTPRQSQGKCTEKDASCNSDKDCPAFRSIPNGNGKLSFAILFYNNKVSRAENV